MKIALRSSTALAGLGSLFGVVAMLATPAHAGGFANKQQSVYFLGSAYAGVAAGGPSIASMFWNPATMTQAGAGFTTDSNYSLLFGNSVITPTSASNAAEPNLLGLGDTTNAYRDSFVPASYVTYRLNDRLVLGFSLNAVYGLKNDPVERWGGMFYGRDSRVSSSTITGQIAYQVNDWLAVGGGIQGERMNVRLNSAFPGTTNGDSYILDASGPGIGYTAGITLTPTKTTTIGIGYRSEIDHDLDGTVHRPEFGTRIGGVPVTIPAVDVGISATLPVPNQLSIGLRQDLTERLTLLGTYEWSNWSRMTSIAVTPVATAPGISNPIILPFNWRDGHYASAGLEYRWNDKLSVRTGAAYEISPITDATRGPRVADGDRIWASAGFSYQYSERLLLHLAYSHVFFKDGGISVLPGNPLYSAALGTFTGTTKTEVDVFGFGFTSRWGAPAKPLEVKG